MRRLLTNPELVVRVQVLLGAILCVASWHKVQDPLDFAKILYNYRLFPAWSIHALAIYVPWIEMVTGMALVLGVFRRGAALMSTLFFVSFILVLGINLARDCPTICGCFNTHADGSSMTDAEKFWEMKKEILLDVCLLALSLWALWGATHAERRNRDGAAASSA